MNTITKININEILGHMVEAEISLNGYFGKVEKTLTGRIIYSGYNASLFFKPKGSKNKGYIIESENDIHSVSTIRKDNKQNKIQVKAYENKEQFEMELEKRLEEEERQREEERRLRQEQFEMERQKKKEQEQKEIEEAKTLGNYEELEKDVINFYQSFEGEFFNENFVKNTYIPIINKLIHKAINSVNEYPKYYFDKKHNPKFCRLVEMKTGVKLGKTQKGNVKILNDYLAG